jgi:acetyl esterase/lipase
VVYGRYKGGLISSHKTVGIKNKKVLPANHGKSFMRKQPIHQELRAGARFIPRIFVSRFTLPVSRFIMKLLALKSAPKSADIETHYVPRGTDSGLLRLRIFRPQRITAVTPVLLWIHGGGHVMGAPEMDDSLCAHYASVLGIMVVAPDYRLAPEHAFPADINDCYSALTWLHRNAAVLRINPARIAVGGASAGGGLAAALVQMALDRKEVKPAFQLLVYPMLDDRTALRTDIDESGFKLWLQSSNRYAWRVYLQQPPGSAEAPEYGAAARRENLRHLPAAWLGVGTLDLFLAENQAYAARLTKSGVPCELNIVAGAYHGFDAWSPGAKVSQAFLASQVAALRQALFAPAAASASPSVGAEAFAESLDL